MANAGQMTQSTYLDIDGLPSRVTALEATAAALPDTYQTLTAAAKQQTCLADLLNGKAKNIVHFMNDGGTWTKITFSPNKMTGALTISTNGAATGNKSFRLLGDMDNQGWSYGVPIPRGTYKITGLLQDAGSQTYRYILGVTTASGATRTTTNIYEDYEFTVSNDTTRIDFSVYVGAGANISTPVVIYPMICRKEAYQISPAFVPWHPDISDMWAAIQAMQT